MRLIHVTDPHLSSLDGLGLERLRGKRLLGYLSWYRKRRHQHCPERLAALTRAVAEDRPGLILVTGDLIHIGLAQEIASARSWLDRLACIAPTRLVPGNHDFYAADSLAPMRKLWSPYLWPDGDQQTFPSSQDCGDIGLIGLSSACPTTLFSAAGRLGDTQLQRLDECLQRHTEARRFRCLYIHHPPLRGIVNRRRALVDAAALESILTHYDVELILHGHLHRNLRYRFGNNTRVYGTASASSCRKFREACYRVFDIAAEAPGWRVNMTLKTVTAQHTASILHEESWLARELN